MLGGIENSSESDSTGVSWASKPSRVTGAPSNWRTTQRDTKPLRTTEAVRIGKNRCAIGAQHTPACDQMQARSNGSVDRNGTDETTDGVRPIQVLR